MSGASGKLVGFKLRILKGFRKIIREYPEWIREGTDKLHPRVANFSKGGNI
jgi:hypothetical protein